MTPTPLTLSRSSLETFLICQRRFKLRTLDRLPWPPTPLDPHTETAVANGRRFHQQIERHFLQLPAETAPADPKLHQWWQAFVDSPPPLPASARFFPELRLSVPVGSLHLVGRFDLLALAHTNGRATAHLFDWKTSRPRPLPDLRADWQTRLYLAMLAEGSRALFDDGQPIAPDDISLTYWYVREPDAPRTIRYSADWHAANWAEIRAIAAQIDAQLADESDAAWPLTDHLAHCRACAYQSYCGRQDAGADMPTAVAEPDTDYLIDTLSEPADVEPDVVPR